MKMGFWIDYKPNPIYINEIRQQGKFIYATDKFNELFLIMEYENINQAKIEIDRFIKNKKLHFAYKFPSIKQHKHYEKMSKRLRSD